MKRCLVLCLMIPLLSSFGQEKADTQVQTLTIKEAIAVGLNQSRTLRSSAARLEAAEARLGEVRASRLPVIKGEASYRRLSDVDPFQVQVPIFPQPIVISPTVLDNTAFRVSLQQPLFTGFRISSTIRVAELSAQAIAFDQVSDTLDLVQNIVGAYFTLYQAREVERYAVENVTRLEQYARDTDRLLTAGAATRNDVLRIQVQLSSARLGLIDAQNDARLAAMNLNILLGRPIDMPVKLASKPEDASWTRLPRLEGALKHALAWRHELRAARTRVEASKASVAAAQSGWWPQIALTGNAYYARPNARYMPARDEFKGTWDIGVVLSMDLWNWGQTARQSEQAEATLKQAELMAAQMDEMVSLEVHRTYLLDKRAEERVKVASLAVQQAEEQSRITEDKYKNGLATSADLLDAQVALYQAKTTMSGAQVERAIAGTRFMRSTGGVRP